MSRAKEQIKKSIKKAAPLKVAKKIEEEEDKPFVSKEAIKKTLDIDELVPPIVDTDEKIDDEAIIAPDTDGDIESDEPDLDDESLNPFGDKWEM